MEYILDNILLMNTSIDIFDVLARILLAVILGGIIGGERGQHGSPAGLRTHILVCLGATMTALAGLYSTEILNYNGDPFRIAAQVVSGIGFLGAGMIIVKKGNMIVGLTTAAGMWTTATIGIALGMGFYMGACLIAIVCVFTATFLTRIERKRKNIMNLYIEANNLKSSGAVVDEIKKLIHKECLIEITPPKSGQAGNLGINITTNAIDNIIQLRNDLEQIENVEFVFIE